MRKIRSLAALAICGAVTLGIAACGSSSSSSSGAASSSSSSAAASSAPSSSSSASSSGGGGGTINGAGSTLAAPIYQQWGSNLSGQGLTVNYQATGSGAGIAQLQAGTVDFAGSDPPMKPSEIKAAKGPVQHFPIAFGAITVSYNLPGIKSGIKLDGKTIADIFQGKVKTWNDPEIKALNAGMSLPSTAITVVHRSDSSGTTKGFTTFLSDYSPAWTAAAGKPDKVVNWPTGTGAKGNAGVAASLKQTTGAIGYVDQAYALQSGLTFASRQEQCRQVHSADAAGELRRGGRDQGPGGPDRVDDQLAEPDRLSDRHPDIPDCLPGHVQGGGEPAGGVAASRSSSPMGSAAGQGVEAEAAVRPAARLD